MAHPKRPELHKSLVKPGAPATIQTWITATENIVMGIQKMLKMLADRVNIIDNRAVELEARVKLLEDILQEQLDDIGNPGDTVGDI